MFSFEVGRCKESLDNSEIFLIGKFRFIRDDKIEVSKVIFRVS